MSESTTDAHAGDLHVRQLELRSVRQESREVDFIASTSALDAHGEIVAQNWDLKRFASNPTVLWSHESRDLPIGQATRCEVVKGKLECTIRLASEKANPKAEQVWQGLLEKTIRAVSVGFCPREMRYERHNDVDVCVLDDNELREISIVTIPSNPESLAKMKAKALASFQASQTQPPAVQERGGEPEKESSMDEKQKAALEMKIAEHEKALAQAEARTASEKSAREQAEKSLADEQTKSKALEGQCERLAGERDAHSKRADEAEGQLVEIEVTSLIGKKIAPSEKDDMVELRKTNKALFERLISKRSEMPHLKAAIPEETNATPTPPVDQSASADADWDRVEKLAAKSAA